MGYTLCNVKGRTWEANRQGSDCGLFEGLPPSRKFSRGRIQKKANIRNAKNLPSVPHEEKWSTKPFDSKSFYALCCCPSHSGHHFVPTAHCTTQHILTLQYYSTFEMSGAIHPTDRASHPRRAASPVTPLWFDSTVRSSTPDRANEGDSCFPSVQLSVQKLETDCHYTSLSVTLLRFIIPFSYL